MDYTILVPPKKRGIPLKIHIFMLRHVLFYYQKLTKHCFFCMVLDPKTKHVSLGFSFKPPLFGAFQRGLRGVLGPGQHRQHGPRPRPRGRGGGAEGGDGRPGRLVVKKELLKKVSEWSYFMFFLGGS